jgi:hypothetical protein
MFIAGLEGGVIGIDIHHLITLASTIVVAVEHGDGANALAHTEGTGMGRLTVVSADAFHKLEAGLYINGGR